MGSYTGSRLSLNKSAQIIGFGSQQLCSAVICFSVVLVIPTMLNCTGSEKLLTHITVAPACPAHQTPALKFWSALCLPQDRASAEPQRWSVPWHCRRAATEIKQGRKQPLLADSHLNRNSSLHPLFWINALHKKSQSLFSHE